MTLWERSEVLLSRFDEEPSPPKAMPVVILTAKDFWPLILGWDEGTPAVLSVRPSPFCNHSRGGSGEGSAVFLCGQLHLSIRCEPG